MSTEEKVKLSIEKWQEILDEKIVDAMRDNPALIKTPPTVENLRYVGDNLHYDMVYRSDNKISAQVIEL